MDRCLVPDTDDLELLHKALAHAFHHVRHELPREPVPCPTGTLVICSLHNELPLLHFYRHLRKEIDLHFPLRPFHHCMRTGHRHGDSGGNADGLFSYARHG